MSRCVILSAGPVENCDQLMGYLREDDVFIAADGGWRLATALGVTPLAFVGDCDSGNMPQYLPPQTLVRRLPVRKDVTDTAAAADLAVELGYRDILILGCTGGRLDHLFAALQLIVRLVKRGVVAALADERNYVTALMKSPAVLPRFWPSKLSLFAFGGPVRQLSVSRASYELKNYDLLPDDPLCISNEPTDHTRITFAHGVLLLFYSKD